MVVAFAPSVGRLLGLSAITVPWGTLVLSVVLYIVMPVIIAQIIRRRMLTSGGQAALDRLLAKLGPASLVALLATLVLRSEEHTSELQSLMRISYAVFCLTKKRETTNYKDHNHTQNI